MRRISSLLSGLTIALIVAIGIVGTTEAANQKYPVFVDCPDDIVAGNHCDSVFYKVRAELPDQNHPNNANIRYHLISGPGEIDERTGLWYWYTDTATITTYYIVEIAASIGNSPKHMTPPESQCDFMVGAIDNDATIMMDGQPKNSVFFITAPGVYRYDIFVQDIDECDNPLIEIVQVDPTPAGRLYLEGDELIFEAAAADDDKKFIVRFTDRNALYGGEQWFVFDTRDSAIPYFDFCPEDLSVTKCDQAREFIGVRDPDQYHNIGITLEVVSGPGIIRGNRRWTFQPTEEEAGQILEVEIAARYGDVVTTSDQNCRFSVTVNDRPAGISFVDHDCGATITAPLSVETIVTVLGLDHDCTPLSLSIADVSPSFDGEVHISTINSGGLSNLIVRPVSFDVGKTFQFTIHGSGESDLWSCDLSVDIIELLPYRVRIEALPTVIQGEHAFVDVVLEEGTVPFGSFSFLLGYDASVIAPVDVIPGYALFSDLGCGWEDFNSHRTHGYDSSNLKDLIFIKGEADNHDDLYPACFLPDSLPVTLFTIDFMVTDDRNFECNSVPIEFYWRDCYSNSFSSVAGRDYFLSVDVFDETGQRISPVDTFPNISGATEDCDRTSQHRLIDFQHGGIHIVCADSIDPRISIGDVNLNGVPFQISDAVLFANYFVYGESVFTIDPYRQAAASDANRDGLLLTIEDLQYMIQVIVGEADPYYQWDNTSSNPAFFRQELDGSVSVATPDTLGAVWLHFDGVVTPQLLVSAVNMNFYHRADSTTSVWVGSLSGGRITAGPLLGNVTAPLLEVQTCTYNGAKVEAIIDQALRIDVDNEIVPTGYALHPNYPNPFNNSTVIQFDLPQASDVTFRVYNMLGRVVYQKTQYFPLGRQVITWDGHSMAGGEVAGGVYFYRIEAGSFTATKKMLLLK